MIHPLTKPLILKLILDLVGDPLICKNIKSCRYERCILTGHFRSLRCIECDMALDYTPPGAGAI